MLPQQITISDITDERTAQLYVEHTMMATFCRVLDAARVTPDVVVRMMAAALGITYRQVAAAHIDGQCPCGWQPSPDDIEAMRLALDEAATPTRRGDLRSMTIAGRA